MGVKQSKCDGVYLPETPTGLKNFRYFIQTPKPLVIPTETMEMPNLRDPRSPSGDRTPISLHEEETFKSKLKQSMPGIFIRKFLKTSNYNINDPRSPNADMNRTPMVFEDGAERGLSLDDTFADLLVETHTSSNDDSNEEHKSIVEIEEEDQKNNLGQVVLIESNTSSSKNNAENNSLSFISMASEEGSLQEHTPIVCMLQQPLDPRSPTYGVERTPIILTDDMDEDQLDEEMEDMLAKLTMHISTAADQSLLSLGAQSLTERDDLSRCEKAPTNKHLERVRIPKKPARSKHSIVDTGKSPGAQIYEDTENIAPKINNCKENMDIMEVAKRTPLSCVGNQEPRLRNMSRMAERKKNKHALTVLTTKLNKSKDSLNEIFLEA